MAYYSLLKTKRHEEIMNIPIQAIGLSDDTLKAVLNAKKIVVNGQVKSYYQTVGDIVTRGIGELNSLLSSSKPRYDTLRGWVLEIEEKLARLGLKIEDSEFTIGDIRIKELELDSATQKFLQGFGKNLRTLDDVIILDYEKLEIYAEAHGDRKQMKKLEQALEKFGLIIEDSNYHLKKSKRFPLTKFYSFFSKEFIDKIEAKANAIQNRAKVLPKLDLTNMNKEEILKLDVRYLTIGTKTVRVFAENGIIYIQDLVSAGENKLKKLVNSFLVTKIENELAPFGIIVDGSNVKIVNGKAVRERFSIEDREGVTSNAPAPVDVLSLSEEDRKKFLSIKISEFGFAPLVEKLFENNQVYKTIGDIVSVSRYKLTHDMGESKFYAINKLEKALKRYNLKFVTLKNIQRSENWKLINEQTFIEGLDFAALSAEEQEQFKKKLLSEVGFGEKMLATCKKLEVTTVGELIEKTLPDLNSVEYNEKLIKSVVFLLSKYNLKLKNAERKDRKDQAFMRLKNVGEMTDEEREEFMKQSVKVLGVSPKTYEKLCMNTLYTVKDVTTVSYSAICKILRAQSARNSLKKAIEKCGLSFGGSNRPWDVKDRQFEASNDAVEIQRYSTIQSQEIEVQHEKKSQEEKDEKGLLEKSVDCLEIGNMAKMFFKSYKLTTLRDIVEANPMRIKAVLSYNSKEYRKLEESLAKYGLLIGMSKEEAEKVAQSNQDGVKSENTEATLILKERDKEQILSKDIRFVSVRPLILSRLRESGINTVRDLCNITNPDLVKILRNNNSHISEIKKVLKNYDLSLKFVRVLDDTYTARTLGNININDMDEKEKQTLLCRSIAELGIKKISFDALIAARIFTIGDLIDAGSKGINSAVKPPMHKKIIYEALENIGVVFEKEKKTPRSPRQPKQPREQKLQAKRSVEVFNVGDLPEDMKQAFLDGKLLQLPLTLQMIQKLENAGYNTVRDFTSSNVKEFRARGFSYTNVKHFKDILSQFGLNIQPAQSRQGIKKPKRKSSSENAVVAFNFNEATEEKKREFLALGIREIGVSKNLSDKLLAAGISTIKDLVEKSYSDLLKTKISKGSIGTISKKLAAYNLGLVNNRKVTKEVIEAFNYGDADEQAKAEFLKSNVQNIGLTNTMTERLSNVGITTIQDLIKMTYTDFRNSGFNQTNVKTIRKRLSNFGLDISLKQNDGKRLVQGAKIKNPQYPVFDFEKANDEERQKFLSSPISGLGLTNVAVERFNNISITTIGDVINYSFSELVNLGIDANMASKVSKKLKDYKLGLKNNRAKVEISVDVVDVSKMDEESREEFLAKSPKVLGLTAKSVDKLKQSNITSIKELITFGYSELKHANLSDKAVIGIKKSLALFGLSLTDKRAEAVAKNREKIRRNRKVKIINVEAPVEIEGEELIQKSVKCLKLSNMLVEKLTDAGFTTIEDLIKASQKDLKEKGFNAGNIRTIKSKLLKINLDFTRAHKQKTDNSQNTSRTSIIYEQLKEKGITALENFEDKYFVAGSKEIEELKNYIREYFTWKTQQLIFSSATEEILDHNLSKIEAEKQEFVRIMEERKKALVLKDDSGLLAKKMGAASKIKREILEILNKYHHDPMMMKKALRELKFRNNINIEDAAQFLEF